MQGFIIFFLSLRSSFSLHAVKCHATSRNRYVAANPIITYARFSIILYVLYIRLLFNLSRSHLSLVIMTSYHVLYGSMALTLKLKKIRMNEIAFCFCYLNIVFPISFIVKYLLLPSYIYLQEHQLSLG